MKRYYYKNIEGNGYLSLKTPLVDTTGYTQITQEEFEKIKTAASSVEHDEKREIEGRIAFLKYQLAQTDYKALKFLEGWLTEEEYAPIKAERQALRDQINELEGN